MKDFNDLIDFYEEAFFKGNDLQYLDKRQFEVIKKAQKKLKHLLEGISDKKTIDDGFGNSWSAKCSECGGKMEVVRPGKVQCSKCG